MGRARMSSSNSKLDSINKNAWVFQLTALTILAIPWLTNYTTLSIAFILVLALVVRATVCGLHTRSSHV